MNQSRLHEAETNVARGQVKNVSDAAEKIVQRRLVTDIGLDHLQASVRVQICERSGRKIVDDQHVVVGGEQTIDEVAADESGAPGDRHALAFDPHCIPRLHAHGRNAVGYTSA